MTVEEMLRIPLGIFERIACSLETIAASCEKTERPPSPPLAPGSPWVDGGAPQPSPQMPVPEAWTVTVGAAEERGMYVYVDGPPFLSPDEARGLAAGLSRAADEAEGI